MDNSRNKQSADTYFTIGVGNLPTGQNTEPNPNDNSLQDAWRGEHNQRAIGSSAIFSPELPISERTESPKPPMGEIFSIEPSSPTEKREASRSTTIEPSSVRMDGDRLSNATLNLAKDAENQLSSTGDADQFVREISSIREALTKQITGKAA